MTLCTSATKKYGKTALIYLVCSIFLAVFGAVYEHFSFGVYSYFMLYAFAFPLVGGVLPALLFTLYPPKKTLWPIAAWPYRASIATMSMGSVISGVLEIYGTENLLTKWYWYIGGGLWVLGAVLYAISLIKKYNETVSEP